MLTGSTANIKSDSATALDMPVSPTYQEVLSSSRGFDPCRELRRHCVQWVVDQSSEQLSALFSDIRSLHASRFPKSVKRIRAPSGYF